jgi:hypothetical protein
MNRFFMSLAIAMVSLLITTIFLPAEPSSPSTENTSPLSPIQFLVGGVWRGELPPNPDGSKMQIDLRGDWSPNHQSIRFDSAFVTGGKSSPYTSGAYSWDPVGKQIVFSYADAEGSLVQGAVQIDNGALVHNFTMSKTSAQVEKGRAILTPHGQNSYTNDIFVEKDGSFQKVVSLTYQRAH